MCVRLQASDARSLSHQVARAARDGQLWCTSLLANTSPEGQSLSSNSKAGSRSTDPEQASRTLPKVLHALKC